jgi:hypothetical protein
MKPFPNLIRRNIVCKFSLTSNLFPMKKTVFISALIAGITFLTVKSVDAQAFRQGSILFGVTEGSTNSVYSTSNDALPAHPSSKENINGTRDPFTIEYGITNRIGVGFTSGSDIYYVNPVAFYRSDISATTIKTITTEFTFNLSYHFYVSQRNDLSLTGSFGTSSVGINGYTGDLKYQYLANGNIFRLGLHARHYFWRRLGVLAMLTTFSSANSPEHVTGNTFGNNSSTSIKGTAAEFGLCLRLRH